MARLCIETALDARSAGRGTGGLFRFIVLGLLRGCGPQHGYGLMKAFERRSGLHVSSGNFYRELRRLVAEGLAIMRARAEHRGDRRVLYAITEAGAALFDEWFAVAPSLTGRGPDDLSARTLFFGDSDQDAAARLLDAWERDIWFQNKVIERGRAAANGQARDAEFPILPLLLSRQARRLAVDVEFLNQVRDAVRDWNLQRSNAVQARPTPASESTKQRGRRPKSALQTVGARR